MEPIIPMVEALSSALVCRTVHAPYYWLLLAESHLTRGPFWAMLQRSWARTGSARTRQRASNALTKATSRASQAADVDQASS